MDLCIDSWKDKRGVPSVFDFICVAEALLELDAGNAETEVLAATLSIVGTAATFADSTGVTLEMQSVEDVLSLCNTFIYKMGTAECWPFIPSGS